MFSVGAVLARARPSVVARVLRKYNHNHVPSGPQGGQFTSGGGSSGSGSSGEGGYSAHPALSHEQQAVSDRFRAQFEANPQAMVDEYMERFGNQNGATMLSADDAKELSADYAKDRESRSVLAPAVHETASDVIAMAYQQALERGAVEGHDPTVVFSAGGPGAGKTSGIQNNEALAKLTERASIVYDSTLSSERSSAGKIQAAIDAGLKPVVIYTHREMDDAWKNGVIPRAMNPERGGRTVPLDVFLESHVAAYANLPKMEEKFAGQAAFIRVDNSRGRGNAAVVEKFGGQANDRYTGRRLHDYTTDLYREGKLPEATYRGLRGTHAGATWKRVRKNLRGRVELGEVVLKFNPNHVASGPDGGQFTSGGGGGASAIVNGGGAPEAPRIGEHFTVYRAGTEKSASLEGRNGGTAGAVASFLDDIDNSEKPSYGQNPTHVYAYDVVLTAPSGEYETRPIATSGVGRNYMGAPGYAAYSFGKEGNGYRSKLVGSIPVDRVRGAITRLGYRNFNESGWEHVRNAIEGGFKGGA